MGLVLLALLAIPTVAASGWRPAVERRAEESGAQPKRLARHLFEVATTAAPGKEVRLLGLGPSLATRRRAAWEQWYGPVASARWGSALWHAAAWALFGLGYVGAVVFVASRPDASSGDVLLVLAAGSRLSSYIGSAAGEVGFLRGVWMDGSRRLAWLEDYAAAVASGADTDAPTQLASGIRLDHVSFRYPGKDQLVLDDVDGRPSRRGGGRAGGGERRRQDDAGQAAVRDVRPERRAHPGRRRRPGPDPARRLAAAHRRRLPGLLPVRAGRPVVGRASATCRGSTTSRRCARRWAGPGSTTWSTGWRQGLDTQLGATWPGGAELSFGQWQKLALARGFMRDQPLLLVLDEPTAALDAETEHALFERYAAAAAGGRDDGRVTVLVSHRFSTVRMADLIVVLDGARVVEVGTHDELVAAGGQYAELYGIQAAAYH